MSYKNYRRISSSRRAKEKEAWEEEVENFSTAVDEDVKSRRAAKKASKSAPKEWVAVPCYSKTYCAE